MTWLLTHSNRARRMVSALLALTCVAVALSFAAPAQSAPVVNHQRIVSAVPDQTPAVNDGDVRAIVQVGNIVVVGGNFTNVTPIGAGAQTRNSIFAFNVSTGALVPDFNPTLNGSVNELIPGPSTPTTTSVYVGGGFTTVNGSAASHVTLLRLTRGTTDPPVGAVVNNFRAASTNGQVNTMVTRGSRLILGGNFSTAGGVAHAGFASLNGTTGALDAWMGRQVSGHHNDSGSGAQGAVGVRDIDITADLSRLVAVGNFKRVDGLLRDQVVLLTLTDNTTEVTQDWQTTRYSPYCFRFAFDTYMRGVSFSPDGSYFVAASTGGHNAGTLCDTAARFETSASGQNIQPTWVDYTGGDTLWAVTVTEKAVYVGGHQRWFNNSLASDRAGPGSVPRPGLAALNTQTGMPLAWNPGRNPRGAAVYALYATPRGLWLGSDTEYIGNHRYFRPRLAFFPEVTGSPEASDATAGLPGTAYLGADQFPTNTNTNDLRTSTVSTSGATPASTVGAGGVDWTTVRGSFVAGGKLWYGKADGTFKSRTFSNGAFGGEVNIDPYNDPEWSNVDTGSNNTYRGLPPGIYGSSVMNTVTGMAYANGKLYYVRNSTSNTINQNLYWRWFNTDSGVIGADEFTANGGRNWSGTMGMFATSGRLYYVTRADGNLNSIALTPTGPTGTPSIVNGPLVPLTGGNDWRTRALFLVGPDQAPPNTPPTAAFTESCNALACNFNAVDSDDADGTIADYAWNFGDTNTTNGPGETASHTYLAAGTYLVRLTVTDNNGATATTSHNVIVTTTQTTPVSFLGSNTGSGNSATVQVNVPNPPSGLLAGDTLVLTASMSNATSASAPTGWTSVGEQTATATLRSKVWVHTVGSPSEAGTAIPVTMDTIHKATLAITAYRGVNAAQVTAMATTDAGTTSHTTPPVTVPNGSWVASFWADKSLNTDWETPAVLSLRAEAYLTGSGAVSEAVADTNGPRSGAVAGSTATSSVASTRGVNWSIVLPPQ